MAFDFDETLAAPGSTLVGLEPALDAAVAALNGVSQDDFAPRPTIAPFHFVASERQRLVEIPIFDAYADDDAPDAQVSLYAVGEPMFERLRLLWLTGLRQDYGDAAYSTIAEGVRLRLQVNRGGASSWVPSVLVVDLPALGMPAPERFRVRIPGDVVLEEGDGLRVRISTMADGALPTPGPALHMSVVALRRPWR